MAWAKLDDGFWANPKVIAAGNEAAGVFVRALSYCANQLTDGRVPAEIMQFVAGRRKPIEALLTAGLIAEDAGAYVIPDYLDFNPSRENKLAERGGARERMQKVRANRKGKRSGEQPAERSGEHAPNTSGGRSATPSRPVPDPSIPTEHLSALESTDAPLSHLLADLIAENGSRRPRVGRGWIDAERLMIERDDRDPVEAEQLIRWCQGDSFWHTVVLSMPKFREKYDQLRLQAKRPASRSDEAEQAIQAGLRLARGAA